MLFGKLCCKRRLNLDHTKIDTVELESPCQELFIHGLGFVVHSRCGLEIYFLSASTGGAIQLILASLTYICPSWSHSFVLGPLHMFGKQQQLFQNPNKSLELEPVLQTFIANYFEMPVTLETRP